MTSNSERNALPVSTGSVLADSTLPRTPTSEAAPLATHTNRLWKNPPRSALVSESTSPVPPMPAKTPPIVWDSAPTVALDRSEDTGDPTATAGAGRAWDARHHGETVDRGQAASDDENGQWIPWPVWNKKFTSVGAAPMRRAAAPEASTAFRPAFAYW